MTRHWIIILTPLVLGFFLAALFFVEIFPDPIFFVRMDAGLIVLILGVTASLLCALTFWLWLHGERKTQLAEMSEATRAAHERHRFLQRLDHELKNPLTAIRAAIVNLADMPRDPAERDALTTVETQTLRLSHLMGNLRKIAELETRPIERAPIDLAEVLRQVVSLADENPVRGHRQLVLTLPHAPWPLPPISGDHDLLVLAIHNLVDNALKFSCADDTIEVRAFEDGPMVAIQVADTGLGIAEDDLPHVWEELYRGQSARSVPGSGLGLALVRAIAERHSGHLSLRSIEGQGTIVTLRLPVGALPR
ncbi:Signal-transduction histidine kinase senX3 [Anaerolineae bacterium]|nr:Signal-transduction histidine kinase senX3 [Anaerolineae bacterium]